MCDSQEDAEMVNKLQVHVESLQTVKPDSVSSLLDALIDNSRTFAALLGTRRGYKFCSVSKGKGNVSCIFMTGW